MKTTPSTTAPSTSITTPTLNTAGLSAQEIKDRRAIQNAWVKYWDTYVTISAVPAAKRISLLAPLTVDPIKTEILAAITRSDSKGQGTYGSVAHRFYWGPAVAGKDLATVGDCMDTSKYGSIVLKTQKKLTKGYVRDNAQGTFARGPDGLWKLQNIVWLVDTKC